jgi:hypothetical protein
VTFYDLFSAFDRFGTVTAVELFRPDSMQRTSASPTKMKKDVSKR